jgi:hypothetical protein
LSWNTVKRSQLAPAFFFVFVFFVFFLFPFFERNGLAGWLRSSVAAAVRGTHTKDPRRVTPPTTWKLGGGGGGGGCAFAFGLLLRWRDFVGFWSALRERE